MSTYLAIGFLIATLSLFRSKEVIKFKAQPAAILSTFLGVAILWPVAIIIAIRVQIQKDKEA